MSTRMTSNEIAANFARQYPTGGWLSKKQAAWIVGVFQAEVREDRRRNGSRGDLKSWEAWGNLYEGEKLVASWSVSISPINGCGNFIITPFVDPRPALQAELAQLESNVAQVQTMNLPAEMLALYTDTANARIARLRQELGIAA